MPVESHSGARESIPAGPYRNLIPTETSRQLSTGKTSHISTLSTGLSFTTRQLEARRGRSSAEGTRVEAPNFAEGTKGVRYGEEVSAPHWGMLLRGGYAPSPENFWTFEWKMAHFGASLVLFMQTAVI